jgi:hypothetical protein
MPDENFSPGEGVPPGFFAWVKKLAQALTIHVLPPLWYDPSSDTIGLDEEDEFYARISGTPAAGTANYPWRQVLAIGGGGWTDGPRSGTATVRPIVEINGVTTLGMIHVYVRRGANGKFLFQCDVCP